MGKCQNRVEKRSQGNRRCESRCFYNLSWENSMKNRGYSTRMLELVEIMNIYSR
jgi:hypothetical protein